MIGSRRDLLKFFGIGATIVPVVGGLPKIEVPAQLVEIPKVVEPPPVQPYDAVAAVDLHNSFRQAFYDSSGCYISVEIKFKDNKQYRFQARSFIVSSHLDTVDITSCGDAFAKRIAVPSPIEWTMKGICANEPRFVAETRR